VPSCDLGTLLPRAYQFTLVGYYLVASHTRSESETGF
jgi:hypothetical protein